MFSFYGSKSKIIKIYPRPIYSAIIEPFAGSARYSLLYFDKDITICDLDEMVIGVWKYLQQATEKDVLSLPNIPNSVELESVQGFSSLSNEEKWLIGYCCNRGSAIPKKHSGKFNSWDKDKIRISKNLYKIKHWNIILGTYDELENKKATYFVDPPYRVQGKWYRKNDINYNHLAEWCKSRNGQVIVCENYGADWLDFKFLKEIPFSHWKTEKDKKKRTKEVVWYNQNT